jgi:hypothetical protein
MTEKFDSGRVRRSDAACDSSNKVKGVRRANVGCSSKPYCYVLLKQPAFSASHRSPVGGGFDHEEMGTDGTESPSGAAGQCDTFSYYVQHICIMCRTPHCLVPSCASYYTGVYAHKLDTPLMHDRLGTFIHSDGSANLLWHVLVSTVSTGHRHCDHVTRLGTQPLVVEDRSEMICIEPNGRQMAMRTRL